MRECSNDAVSGVVHLVLTQRRVGRGLSIKRMHAYGGGGSTQMYVRTEGGGGSCRLHLK
jgi:hypothetical protein